MASLINDPWLLTLVRPNRMPAMQVSAVQKCASNFRLQFLEIPGIMKNHFCLGILLECSPQPAPAAHTFQRLAKQPPPCTSVNRVLFSTVLN